MRKLAILLTAVLTLNLAAPAAPVYAAQQSSDAESENTVNEEFSEEETETVSTQEAESTMDDTSDLTEETTLEETSASEEDYTGEEVSVSEEDSAMEEEATTEENMEETEIAEEVVVEAVSNIVAASNEVVTEDVTMSLDAETSVTLQDSDSFVWLKFTAPKDSYYNFTAWSDEGKGNLSFYRNSKVVDNYQNYIQASAEGKSMQIYADAGEVLYFKAYQNTSEEVALSAVISEIKSVTPIKDENGIYNGTYGDYILQTTLSAGCTYLAYDFVLLPSGENTLSGTYRLKPACREISSLWVPTLSQSMKYSASGSAWGDAYKKNSTYTIDAVLEDGSGNVICAFIGMTVISPDTDKPAVWTIKEITYNSATVICERLSESVGVYYGKKGTSEKQSMYDRKNTYTLEPATEYRIWAEDYDGNVLYEETFVTQDIAKAAYNVTAECGAIAIEANVSEYMGSDSGIYLCYSYKSDKGESGKERIWVSLTSDGKDKGKSGTANVTIDGLSAETTYDIELALSEIFYDAGKDYAKQTKSVTTPAGKYTADDVEFTLWQNEDVPTTLHYRVDFPEHESEELVSIYYRMVGDAEWKIYSSDTISSETDYLEGFIANGYIADDLVVGQEYQVKAVIAGQGIHKVASIRLGDEIYHPVVSDEADTFDATLTYELPAEEADSASVWSVVLGYTEVGSNIHNGWVDEITLSEENEYKATIDTAQYATLTPDTEYLFKWSLYKDGNLCHTKFQTITTKPLSAKVEVDSVGYNSANYTVTLLSGIETTGTTVYLYPRISKKNGTVVSDDTECYFSISDPGAKTISVNLPDDDTEYEITLYYNDEPVGESVTFKTGKDGRTLTMNEVTGKLSELVFDYTLSGESMDTSYTVIHIYVREKGQTEWECHEREYVYEPGKCIYRIAYNIKEDTTYEYVIGIGKSDYTTAEYLKEKLTGEVKTLKDDRAITLDSLNGYLHNAEAKVTLTGIAADYTTNVINFFWREKGTDNWAYSYQYAYSQETVTLESGSNLIEDTDYEYVIGISDQWTDSVEDLEKTVTGEFRTLADDRTLAVEVEPSLHTAIFKVTVSGDAANGMSGYVKAFYKEKGTENEECLYISYTGAGTVQQPLGYTGTSLKENTEYEYVIGYADSYEDSKEDLKNTKTGEFKTIADDRALILNNVTGMISKLTFDFSLTGEAAKKVQTMIAVYAREEGETEWKYTDYTYMNNAGDGMLTISEDIKEDTTYEYIIGIDAENGTTPENWKEKLTGKVTTPKDDRVLSVNVTEAIQWANFKVVVSGEVAGYGELQLFYKEKGSENEESQTFYYYGPGTYEYTVGDSYYGSLLKEDTEYEYVIGFADDYCASKEELKHSVSGNFKTLKDTRELSEVSCEAGYETVYISATVTNNTSEAETYIHYFVRAKGTEGWSCYTVCGGSDSTIEEMLQISDCNQGTEYEYVVVLSDREYINSPDEVVKETQKKSGTFTTKANKYKVDISADNSKCTYDKGYVNVAVTGDNSDEKLYVTLYVSDGVQAKEENIVLLQARKYKSAVILTGLNSKTEYAITGAAVSVEEYGNRIVIAQQNFDNPVTFTTKEIPLPESLTLPVEELYLNAAGGGAFISEQMINATVTPPGAVKDLNWVSDNENVVTVNNGYIQAVGSGSATITVSSVDKPEVKDNCKVIVKDYVVAKENETGIPEVITESIEMYKGEVLKGYALYERGAEGELNKVDGMKVSVERSLVAEWTADGLKAIGTGASEVYFEANGVKAVFGINVLSKAIGFGLVGLDSTDAAYPAVCTGDGVYTIANKDGLTYTVIGEITPADYFDAATFEWTSSDESIATVENGVISPVTDGIVTITATPIAESTFVQSKASITVNVKAVPQQVEVIPTVYALIKSKKMTLKDVAFPAEWGTGWSWRDPKTPLYTLPVHADCYAFEASYTGDDFYPYEGLVNVYISKINSVYAYEEGAEHNHVIEVGENDSIMLRIESEHMGVLPANYSYELSYVDGLTIEETESPDVYRITAQKAGKYKLTPTISITDETGEEIYSMSGTKYSIKATSKSQVASIELSCDNENFEIVSEGNEKFIKVNFTENMKNNKFILNADVRGKQGEKLSGTRLQWKTTDKTVAAVSYKKNTSHKAEITVKGAGHAILSVTACDDTAYTTQLGVEIRDYKPRINTNKAKVNIAYDYYDSYGITMAYENYGLIEIAGVYGDVIDFDDIRIVKNIKDENGESIPEDNLSLMEYGDGSSEVPQFIVVPAREEIPIGKYDCLIEVKMQAGEKTFYYYYPMTVTVVDEAPKVSAKMGTNVNLFYLGKSGSIRYTIKGLNYGIRYVEWEDKAPVATGFYVSSYADGEYGYVSHDDVKVIDGKPVDSKVATGTLTIRLNGIRKPIEIKDFKIKYSYKKPTLEARKATTTIAPTVGNQTAGFYIYDKLNKNYVSYDSYLSYSNPYYYYELSYDNDYVEAKPSGSYVYTTYSGTKTSETVTYTLHSYGWREPLTVKQTIKSVAPKATLSPATLTYNKAYNSAVSTAVYVGNVTSFATPDWLDLEVKGADTKSKALVENSIIDIVRGESAQAPITVTLNRTSLLNLDQKNALKAGSYKFKVTPYYRNQDTGAKMKLNTLNMTVKVVDKPVTVKVTPKGSLDITMMADDFYTLYLKSDFKNLGQDYTVTGAELKGEYSKYFELVRLNEYYTSPNNYYYLQLSEYGKVKANQKYKLTVEYTVSAPNGDTFTVQSNAFTIKPKQSAPKVSVYKNDQIIYAASDMSRRYEIAVSDYYSIQEVSGSLDCNKDGYADIVLQDMNIERSRAGFMVSIVDKDAVVATQKGKSYTIPVTVKLAGRDGISKDAKVNIKVKVKR